MTRHTNTDGPNTTTRVTHTARRLLRGGLLIATVALVVAATALAFYESTGNSAGTASIGAINPPTSVVAKAANGSTSTGPSPVTITWVAPNSGASPTTYQVVRDNGSTKVTLSCTSTPCTDSSPPDGTYTYDVSSLLGTSWTSTATTSNSLLVDSTPPTTTITYPGSGPYNATSWNAGAPIAGTASDPAPSSGLANVQVSIQKVGGNYWNGTSFGSATEQLFPATGASAWSLAFAADNFTKGGGGDGNYTVRTYATDNAGNIQVTATSQTFTYDNTTPTTAISFPGSGFHSAASYNTGCSPTGICGTADDATGVAEVRISVLQASSGKYWDSGDSSFDLSGEAFNNATLASPGASSTTWDLPLTLPSDGSYTVHVQAKDTLGNDSAPANTSTGAFSIDTTAPTTTATPSPAADGAGWNNANVSVTLSPTDGSGSGVASTVYSENGAQTLGATTYSGPIPVNAEGITTITFHSTDDVGNVESPSKTVTIKLDKTNPAVSISSITAGGTSTNCEYVNGSSAWYSTAAGNDTCSSGSGSFTVAASASDSGSGVNDVNFPTMSGFGGGGDVLAPGPYSKTYTWTGSTNTSPTTDATATDVAGNTSTAGFSFTLDDTAPSGSVTSPAANAVLTGATNSLTASASDNLGGSGVKSVQYLYCEGAPCTPSTSIGTSTSGSTYPFNFDVSNSTTFPSGSTLDIAAKITDNVGNTFTTGVVAVSVQQTITVTESAYNSGGYTLTVPAHVTSFTFTLDGAGGGAAGAAGGNGGSVSGTVTLPDHSAAINIHVVVGQGGRSVSNGSSGGLGGGADSTNCTAGGPGGAKADGENNGAGGGGATCFYVTAGSPIAVAGGGGGGAGASGGTGGDGSGGSGGSGSNGSPSGTGGGGATGSSGGTGVAGSGCASTDSNGSSTSGGTGANSTGNKGDGGGGGGGGYYGGGGGGCDTSTTGGAGGGGGGSGYSGGVAGSFTVTNGSLGTGNGSVGSNSNSKNGTDGSVSFTGPGLTDPPADPEDGSSSSDTDMSTADTTSNDTNTTDTTPTNTDTAPTDTSTTGGTTDTSASATAGLSTPRGVLFFGVLGGTMLGLAALLTMPIPRRRRARRRRAG